MSQVVTSDQALLKQYDASYDAELCLLRSPFPGQHAIAQRTLHYAILLLQRNEPGDHEKAHRIITAVLDTQLHQPEWERGRFPFLLPETWRDLNANLFMTPHLVELYTRWRSQLPADLATRLETAIHDAVNIVQRRWADELFDLHRDFVAYSNIFVLYINSLYALGKALNLPQLTRDAKFQWQRWFNHTAHYGVDEFASPTYNHVIYRALLEVHEMVADDPSVQKEVALVLDHLTLLQQAINHPAMEVEAVGSSRDYRLFVEAGKGAFPYLAFEGSHGYTPPAGAVKAWRGRAFPYRVTGRAGTTPFLFQSWQDRQAALGTMTGGHYFPQQIHLMAAVGTTPANRACAFLNADPASAIQGFTRQHDRRALCLFSRTPSPYHRYQLRTPPADHDQATPAERALPACLGITQGWESIDQQHSRLAFTAHGHTLHMMAFTLGDDGVSPMTLTKETVDVGRGMAVTGYRADEKSIWTAFFIELLPQGQQPAEADVQGSIGDDAIVLEESGGLKVELFRRPNGELVDLFEKVDQYKQDWRTLPLLQTPDHTLHAGDLLMASLRKER